jgi:nicotinamide-nucleotide amidase
MAVGAKQHSQAAVIVSATGIAGPGGGMPGKPVGLVHFGWCIGDLPVVCDAAVFAGDRQAVRQQTVMHALQGIISRVGALG